MRTCGWKGPVLAVGRASLPGRSMSSVILFIASVKDVLHAVAEQDNSTWAPLSSIDARRSCRVFAIRIDFRKRVAAFFQMEGCLFDVARVQVPGHLQEQALFRP